MPFAEVAGTRLHYFQSGRRGVPVVLLHAWPLDARMWAPQVQALGDRLTIAIDLKGFGRSDAPEDRAVYSMESYAAEVLALLDSLSIERAVIAGLSMGGYVAFALLRSRPDAIAALVLADTRAEADTPEAAQRRLRQQDAIRQGGPGAVAEGLLQGLLGETTRARRPEVVGRVKELMTAPAAGFIGALEAMRTRPDSTPDVTAVAAPCLVVVGDEDVLTPVDGARALHRRISGSKLVVIEGAGHLSNLEAPEPFNDALASFVAEI